MGRLLDDLQRKMTNKAKRGDRDPMKILVHSTHVSQTANSLPCHRRNEFLGHGLGRSLFDARCVRREVCTAFKIVLECIAHHAHLATGGPPSQPPSRSSSSASGHRLAPR